MFSAMLWWQLLVLIVTSVLCAAFLVSFITKRGISVKAKGVEIGKSSSPTPGKAKEKSSVPSINVVTCKDILLVVEWATMTTRQISHMEDILLIKEQMNYAESQMGEVRDILRRTYLKILKQIKKETVGLIQTHEAHDYENVLKILTNMMLDEFRVIFRENHLAERNELDFELYIKSKKEHFNNRVTEILNDIYPPDITPSREVVYEADMLMMNKILDIFEQVIRQGKYITIEYVKKKKFMLKELDDKISKIISST